MKKAVKKVKKAYDPAFRKYVKNLCAALRKTFFAGEYNLDVCWCKEAVREPGEEIRGEVRASISLDPRYLDCTIHVHQPVYDLWKNNDLYGVGRVIVHEFSHILIDPVYFEGVKGVSKERSEMMDDIRERQTQRVANVVWELLPAKVWNNKNGYASIKNKRRRK